MIILTFCLICDVLFEEMRLSLDCSNLLTESNRPNSFIYVFTHNKKILNSLSLFWGIYGFYYDKFNSTDETIKDLHNILKRKKIIKLGQLVINIGSMPIMEKGMTNMLKMSRIN